MIQRYLALILRMWWAVPSLPYTCWCRGARGSVTLNAVTFCCCRVNHKVIVLQHRDSLAFTVPSWRIGIQEGEEVREIFIQTSMSGLWKESTLCLVSLVVIPNAGEVFTPENFVIYANVFPSFEYRVSMHNSWRGTNFDFRVPGYREFRFFFRPL